MDQLLSDLYQRVEFKMLKSQMLCGNKAAEPLFDLIITQDVDKD